MRCFLERDLLIPPEKELLAPNKEPQEGSQDVLEQVQMEDKRGGSVETSTQD